MKRLLTFVVAIAAFSMSALAQLGMFNHLGVDVSAGTTGIGIELSTPVTSWVQLRGGLSIMPSFKFKTDIDAEIELINDINQDLTVNVEGDVARTQGNLIVNVYPFGPVGGFFVAGGLYFGGEKIIGVSGHSDEVAQWQKEGLLKEGYIELGDYKLDFEKNGTIKGGLVANKVRPYLGIGFGRPCPGHRLGFMFEVGAQFMGKMKVCQGSDLKPIDMSNLDNDDDWQKVMDKLTVYPVLKFTLCGKIF